MKQKLYEINNETKESTINNESIIYDLLKKVGKVGNVFIVVNNNGELINNSLKTINTLVTIIFLKKQSKNFWKIE